MAWRRWRRWAAAAGLCLAGLRGGVALAQEGGAGPPAEALPPPRPVPTSPYLPAGPPAAPLGGAPIVSSPAAPLAGEAPAVATFPEITPGGSGCAPGGAA